jgi:hypothetical protein
VRWEDAAENAGRLQNNSRPRWIGELKQLELLSKENARYREFVANSFRNFVISSLDPRPVRVAGITVEHQ